jgi:tetratricopeptide (TPR) repeat protein
LKFKIKIGDKKGESACYTSLGTTYYYLGDYAKAIDYYEKGLKIEIKIGDKKGESACYYNLSLAYNKLGDPKKAR